MKPKHYPVYIQGKNHNPIFTIDMQGKISLRGKEIGQDKELADILTELGRTISEADRRMLGMKDR